MSGMRFPGWVALLAVPLCLLTGRVATSQEAKARGRSSAKITVKISADKVKTNFVVKKGEWMEFECEGKWRIWEGYAFTDAEGQYQKANAQGRWAALVAQVGKGPPIGYGDGLPVQAPATGKVVLWPNRPWDPPIDKGEGELRVTIHVGDHLKAKRQEGLAKLRRQTRELQADKEVQKCLADINALRKICGLKPVALNTRLSIDCQKHARYLMVNRGHRLTAGLKGHEEYEELKEYSIGGARAGKSSVIGGLPSHMNAWQTTFYHRVPFMKPQLTEVGIGYHRDGKDCRSCVDIWSSTEGNAYKAITYYPENKQTGVPLRMDMEIPDPIPENHRGKPAGFPITVHFAKDQKVTRADIKLFDEKGILVGCHVSSPEKPAIASYPEWYQMNTICAIPMAPLAPAATYRVELR
jgi:hypothetical protein